MLKVNLKYQMCCSRKHPYLPHRRFLVFKICLNFTQIQGKKSCKVMSYTKHSIFVVKMSGFVALFTYTVHNSYSVKKPAKWTRFNNKVIATV